MCASVTQTHKHTHTHEYKQGLDKLTLTYAALTPPLPFYNAGWVLNCRDPPFNSATLMLRREMERRAAKSSEEPANTDPVTPTQLFDFYIWSKESGKIGLCSIMKEAVAQCPLWFLLWFQEDPVDPPDDGQAGNISEVLLLLFKGIYCSLNQIRTIL